GRGRLPGGRRGLGSPVLVGVFGSLQDVGKAGHHFSACDSEGIRRSTRLARRARVSIPATPSTESASRRWNAETRALRRSSYASPRAVLGWPSRTSSRCLSQTTDRPRLPGDTSLVPDGGGCQRASKRPFQTASISLGATVATCPPKSS